MFFLPFPVIVFLVVVSGPVLIFIGIVAIPVLISLSVVNYLTFLGVSDVSHSDVVNFLGLGPIGPVRRLLRSIADRFPYSVGKSEVENKAKSDVAVANESVLNQTTLDLNAVILAEPSELENYLPVTDNLDNTTTT